MTRDVQDTQEKPEEEDQAKHMEVDQSEQFKQMCQNIGLTLEPSHVQRLKDMAKLNPFNLGIRPRRGPPSVQTEMAKSRRRSPKPAHLDQETGRQGYPLLDEPEASVEASTVLTIMVAWLLRAHAKQHDDSASGSVHG